MAFPEVNKKNFFSRWEPSFNIFMIYFQEYWEYIDQDASQKKYF